MNVLQNKKTLILIGLAIVAVLLVAFVIRDLVKDQESPAPYQPIVITEPEPVTSSDPAIEPGTDNDPFREEAPVITRIPAANEVLPAEQQAIIAVPTMVVPAAPGVESSFRNFNISGEGGKFVPEKIIAEVGDTVHINFTAVDSDYDIVFPSYNMKQTAKMGQTKVLEFQAVKSGSFLYYCEACGGVEGTAKGNIIIVE